MIVKNKNVRYMKLKELRTILKTQKYTKMVAEKGIEKTLSIPQEQFRSEKLRSRKTFMHIRKGNIQKFSFLQNERK